MVILSPFRIPILKQTGQLQPAPDQKTCHLSSQSPKSLYSSTVIPYHMEKETITLKGDRDLWVKFVNRLREERKTVWDDVLSPVINKYMKKRMKTR